MITKIDSTGRFFKCLIPLLVGLVTATIFFLIRGLIDFFFVFSTIGMIASVGLIIHGLTSKKNKKRAKYFTFTAMFLFMSSAAIIFNENFQIEHFLFSLITYTYLGAITHYAVAKVVGPIFFGRFFCGWGCWTAAAFEILPAPKKKKLVDPRFKHLRYLSLAASIALCLTAVYGFGYRPILDVDGVDQIVWFIIGSSSYYVVGLILMYSLGDRRAFCKYVCPASIVQKAFSWASLLKIKGDMKRCKDCGLCVKKCPMDVKVTSYVKSNRRVQSTECIACSDCVSCCPTGALRWSVGVDIPSRNLAPLLKARSTYRRYR